MKIIFVIINLKIVVKQIEFFKATYFEVGVVSLKRVDLYKTNNLNDDEFIVYNGLIPVAYFTMDEQCGLHTRELFNIGKVSNVQIASFLNNFLKYTTGKLSIWPMKKQKLLVQFKTTDQKRIFELPYYNMDKDWESLSEAGIKKIVKMSKSTLNAGAD